MAGKPRYLKIQNGNHYAQMAIPGDVQQVLGKKSLSQALGSDRRDALRQLPAVVAQFQNQIAAARKMNGSLAPAAATPKTGEVLDLKSPAELASMLYSLRLKMDESARNQRASWAQNGIDDLRADTLRKGIGGSLGTDNLQEIVGAPIDYFRSRGHTIAQLGTPAWTELARALCAAEYEALERMVERDEGDYSGTPRHPLLAAATTHLPTMTPPAPAAIVQPAVNIRDWSAEVVPRPIVSAAASAGAMPRRSSFDLRILPSFTENTLTWCSRKNSTATCTLRKRHEASATIMTAPSRAAVDAASWRAGRCVTPFSEAAEATSS
jgi:hypothetical protein